MNLKPIVKETMGLLRASLPTTIQLEPNISADTGMILADPSQIQQVLMNLCTNAAHAMEEKGGVLKIGLSNAETGQINMLTDLDSFQTEYIRLTISDTGQGMQPWILKRIFEPYFTTKQRGKGTGLGLSVVHGIVKSHGGTIKVSSVAGRGSIFDVYLPKSKREATEASAITDTPPVKGTGRILFVDDEPAIAGVAEKMLWKLGYQVKTTTSPIEALEIFRSAPSEFDLIITDLTMPQLTGLELASAVLETSPGFPILLCTGFSDWVKEDMLKSIGICGLLIKPITIHEFGHSIRMAMRV
jgi:CheY-like chemotaxis protein